MAEVTRAEAPAVRPTGPGEEAGVVEGGDVDVRLRERLRALLCCLCLVLLATATRPGRIIADTKIDMAVNPLGFLGRALHLWDVEQFGQLQNQAAGYLFPMGPFYALGHLAGMPAWITQRLWLGTLLCAAFLGARRLAARLGIGTPGGRLIGALAYALSPHALASLGTNSSEYLPLAMLPWMVLPLVTAASGVRDGEEGGRAGGRRGGGRIRAAARSGLAVACCGGINGTATLAVLAVPVLFVLTRPRGSARLRLLAWWGAAVVIATMWWSVPLFLLGRYAFSWLLYTEKAGTTTSTTGLVNVFRGAERWVNFLTVDGNAWWPLGHAFATQTLPVLCTGAVAALGVAGLARSRLPERTFLLVTLLAGVTVMVAGHSGPLAPEAWRLIDGPLAPFRNLYKFDGLVRLPLALGIAHLLAPARLRRTPGRLRRTPRWTWPAVAALAGLAVPALATGLSATGDFPAVPQYWRDATTWLNGRAGDQGVIAVPGARFGEYIWGRPMDEISQPLLRVRWAERQLVPAGSPGLSRLMDAIDQRITSGQGSAGLSEVLARMGVRYILVRNDLRREDLRGAWPARVHEALDSSPGIRRVAWFGGAPAGTNWPDDAVNTIDQPYPPVEIYEVAGADDVVSMTEATRALRLYGSPEALLTMADNGLLRGRPVLFGDDAPGTGGKPVVADSLRRVERNFGELRGQTSPTMTATEKAGEPGQRRDIMEPGWDRYSTVVSYSGIKDVTASTSASDITSIAQLDDPGALPYAAIDGSTWTRWETGGWGGPVGQWLKIDFDRPLTPRNVTAMFTQDAWLGPPPDRVSIETESGRVEQRVVRTSAAQPLGVAAGPTRWLRIRVLGLAWKPAVRSVARVAVPELHIDGVGAVRHYRLPAAPADGTIVMSRAPGRLPGCMRGSVRWVCAPSLQRQDEEAYGFDRIFPVRSATTARLSGTAALTDPGLIERYTSTDPRLKVQASSVATREPAGMPRSAFDGDPATTWVPAVGDRAPWLSLSWKRKVRVGRVTVRRPPGASGPLQVRVEGDHGQWSEAPVGGDGVLSFKPMTTTRLTLRFSAASPLQVTDVTVPRVAPFRSLPNARVPLPCGFGPRLRLNGAAVPTRATGTFGDLLSGRAIPFRACGAVTLKAGDNGLAAVPFDAFRVDSAVVSPAVGIGLGLGAAPRQEPSPVTVTRWTPEHRQVEVDAARDSYLVVNENLNAGWQATIGGRILRPVRLDGWRQAWVVPAGTAGPVRLSYRPDRTYQAAVLTGLSLLLVLLIVALWPSRWRPGAPRPPGEGRAGPVRDAAAVLVATGLGFWVGGFAGTAVAAVAAAAFVWTPLRLRTRLLSPWPPAAVLLAATASLAVGLRLQSAQSAGSAFLAETLPQLLCLVVVARLAVALRGAPGPGCAREPAD
jgi:arabinofuranan 3-O-arabinosyltransferase